MQMIISNIKDYNKIAELLTETVKGVKIVRSREVAPETAVSSSKLSVSKAKVRKLASKLRF